MAKLSDLPAELVSRIVHYVFYYIMPLQTSTDTPVDATHSVTTTRWTTPKSSTTRPNGKYDLTKKDSEVMEVLFKNVLLQDTRHADKFLQALTSKLPRESQPTRKRQKRHDSPSRLSQYVRSLQFDMRGARPTGKRGGSLFCKILQHCPLLENLLIGNQLALVCKEPILEALASTPFIKEILLSNMTDREHGESFLQWKAHDVVSGLFSHWNGLETVEISGLTGWADNQTFPVLNCAIRTEEPQLWRGGALESTQELWGEHPHALNLWATLQP
ncbi:hypothetical protein PCASD_02935 [Puccinia coronata f. sp. avenae]|uniref:Uncharacterized protein n=1 Tax=Puccinia coronata f. sp. avenae TaxID=200324 RepID=A0A2N5VED4_9BASI|nr:hypothetical protein PCASD_02935 [Puccinia coronata f. sp. avenae]